MSFAQDMARISTKIDNRLDQLGRAVKLDLFNGVIRDTRVKTGRARGNWQMQEGSPATGELDRLDPSGALAMEDVARVTPFSLSYLSNNLPYIRPLEELDGMVARNVQRAQDNVARKARELSR